MEHTRLSGGTGSSHRSARRRTDSGVPLHGGPRPRPVRRCHQPDAGPKREEAPAEALDAWLRRQHGLDDHTVTVLTRTYGDLRDLRSQGRNHIWGFVARNLVRPVWLSQANERADVIVGNPPWLSWRYMSPTNADAFRYACQERGIWVGQVAQQQDLSAYFFARCVELYFKTGGLVAFVMPYAAMSRRQFSRFRLGIFGRREARPGRATDSCQVQLKPGPSGRTCNLCSACRPACSSQR